MIGRLGARHLLILPAALVLLLFLVVPYVNIVLMSFRQPGQGVPCRRLALPRWGCCEASDSSQQRGIPWAVQSLDQDPVSMRMPLCQLMIKVGKHLCQIGVNGQDRDRHTEAGAHHLDVACTPEHRPHPLQLVTKMLTLPTVEQRAEGRQAAAQAPARDPHPVNGVRNVDAHPWLTRRQLVQLRTQVGHEQLARVPRT